MGGKPETDAKGIPIKGPYPPSFHVFIVYPLMTCIFATAMGYIAHTYIVLPHENNRATKDKIQFMSDYDLGYLYLSFIILRIGQLVMGMVAGNARKHCKVHPPDQHIYSIHGEDKMGYVLLDQDGVNGRFNRAQRAIQNYQETFPQNALYVIASGLIYPKEVCRLVGLFAVARVFNSIGYTHSTDGRIGGFMISQLIGAIWECLTGIIAYKAITHE